MTFLTILALSIFATQGLLMIVDEFHFHRRREMPRWERIGHPLDTLTVLLPLLGACFLPHHGPWTFAFVAAALFSCVFVTKDEAVHARLCGPGEQWIHAMLFLLHPLVFAALWILWKEGERGWLALQAAVTFGFLCRQLFAWNGPWATRKESPR